MICWTIARIATGRLRAHPYLQYQKGLGAARQVADMLFASCSAFEAKARRNRSFDIYAVQFQALARVVDDVRALTWSPDLSDALGRIQLRVHRLANELDAAAHTLNAAPLLHCARAHSCTPTAAARGRRLRSRTTGPISRFKKPIVSRCARARGSDAPV